MELVCAFAGHKPTRFRFKYKENHSLCKKIKRALSEQVTTLYAQGIRRFVVGGMLGVDFWAGEAVLELQKLPEYQDIELVAVLPYRGYDANWDRKSRARLARLLSGCVDVKYAKEQPTQDAYKARNYRMVEESSHFVAVYDNDSSVRSPLGMAINYARKRALEITLIHPDTGETTRLQPGKISGTAT